MNKNKKGVIKSFRDLHVYQNTYKASIKVATKILTKLPLVEKYDLVSQMRRASKAIPRLIAEGFAKKHQKRGFQKYLDDAMAECNELLVCLEHIKDIYGIEKELCNELINVYDKSARKIFVLAEVWDNFTNRRRKSRSYNQTGSDAKYPDPILSKLAIYN